LLNFDLKNNCRPKNRNLILNFALINARSLRSVKKVEELGSLLNSGNIDILACSESWLDDSFRTEILFFSDQYFVIRKIMQNWWKGCFSHSGRY